MATITESSAAKTSADLLRVATGTAEGPPLADGATSTDVPGELLVTFDETVSPKQREAILAAGGMQLVECSPSGVCRAVPADVDAASDKNGRQRRTAALAADTHLRGLPVVRCVEPNPRRFVARTPNDAFFASQWHYNGIHLPEAWDMTTGSDDVIVAVIDTGILSGHPDLQGRIVAGYDFISDPASARDGDGRDPDPEDEGDLLGGPGQSSFHGTHVVGTVGASTNNDVGVAGGTWQTRIMPLRALGVDGGTAFDVAEAIRYAAGLSNITGTVPAKRANIINLSLVGAPGELPASVELDALAEASAAGVLIVAAAGNSGSSLPAYPAAAPEVISVSAVDIQLDMAHYSNFGPTIDMAGPGGFLGADLNGDRFADGVLSTGASDLGGTIDYQYVFSAGTSMAAPHVAAVAALVLAANPDLSAGEVRDILESTARDLGSTGKDNQFGFGLVDAAAAVREAYRRAGVNPPATGALTASTGTVNLGMDRSGFRFQVTDTSGNALEITSVMIQTLIGSGWLRAEAEAVPAGSSTGQVTIGVDRTGLADGEYRGTVTVEAVGLDAAEVTVVMAVGAASAGRDTIYVLAVDSDTQGTIGEETTTSAAEYRYLIDRLPAGSYVLYAGTDRDNNGYICEEGDLCGALPSRLEPQVFSIKEGEQFTNADFAVARLVLRQMVASREPAFRPRRPATR
ncbi:MAG TPA: S8 family serine peptidase [Phycisphaerae bacterium]|nr:S8 family serine peptidase [Phycisphaerae bacterium]